MLRNSIFFLLVFFILLPGILVAQGDTTYVEGQFILKVTTPFTSIDSDNGIIITEQGWFNTLAQQYEISELVSVFNSSQENFSKWFRAVFSTNYTVEEVIAAFQMESEVEHVEPNYIYVESFEKELFIICKIYIITELKNIIHGIYCFFLESAKNISYLIKNQ